MGSMLGVLVDVVLLAIILFFVNRDEASEWLNLLIVVLLMAGVNFVCGLFLSPHLGILALAPAIAINGLILMYKCGLTWGKALLVLAILYGVKIGLVLLIFGR